MVTANTFNELVLDDTKDVFLDVYADWCGPCVAVGPTIVQLAKVLNHVETLRICKLDCDENDTDPEYLPETSIPNMKLFPAGNKKIRSNTLPTEPYNHLSNLFMITQK